MLSGSEVEQAAEVEEAVATPAAATVAAMTVVSEADLLLQELCVASRHVNLLVDEGWLPPTLEFFYQHEDVADRVAFLQVGTSVIFFRFCNPMRRKTLSWMWTP